MRKAKYFIVFVALMLSITGCGAKEDIAENMTEPQTTYSNEQLLTLYYLDGSKEEIVFEWKDITKEYNNGIHRTCYYSEESGAHFFSDAVCIVNGDVVYYKKEGNYEFEIFSGTFKLEPVENTN